MLRGHLQKAKGKGGAEAEVLDHEEQSRNLQQPLNMLHPKDVRNPLGPKPQQQQPVPPTAQRRFHPRPGRQETFADVRRSTATTFPGHAKQVDAIARTFLAKRADGHHTFHHSL